MLSSSTANADHTPSACSLIVATLAVREVDGLEFCWEPLDGAFPFDSFLSGPDLSFVADGHSSRLCPFSPQFQQTPTGHLPRKRLRPAPPAVAPGLSLETVTIAAPTSESFPAFGVLPLPRISAPRRSHSSIAVCISCSGSMAYGSEDLSSPLNDPVVFTSFPESIANIFKFADTCAINEEIPEG